MNQTDRHAQPNNIVPQLVFQSTQADADQLKQIVDTAAAAPFANNLLEVDEPLWGSFWHGDVIAPGYRLPAVELALLRAVRLDEAWPEETGVEQYLSDLHQTIQHPHTGIWTLAVADQPWVVFGRQGGGTGDQELITVVWYCATTGQLHAGYRTPAAFFYLENAVEQRRSEITMSRAEANSQLWLTQIDLAIFDRDQTLAARLDREILRLRQAGTTRKRGQ